MEGKVQYCLNRRLRLRREGESIYYAVIIILGKHIMQKHTLQQVSFFGKRFGIIYLIFKRDFKQSLNCWKKYVNGKHLDLALEMKEGRDWLSFVNRGRW